MCAEVADMCSGGMCDAECEVNGQRRCWGSGPQMCQKRNGLFMLHF